MNRKKALKIVFFTVLIGAGILLGILAGGYVAIRRSLPSVDELEKFEPNIITYVYADEGKVIKEFAIERRVEVSFAQIPDMLKKAIIATEDPRFYNHKGVDYRGILRAIKENLRRGRLSGRLEGGSTITQQLARLLFLYPQQTLRRKFMEWFLSRKIEKRYSKDKILELYCNLFYLGHGVYGVETASRLFFGKSVSELNLEEAALIAGIFRGPSIYSPYSNSQETFRRRNHVLRRMMEEGYITKKEAEAAQKKPMNVLPLQRAGSDFGAYFFEEVRKYIEKKYGSDALYRQGLKVYTTLNPTYQKFAEDALLEQLRTLDKTRGWRKDKKNLLAEGVPNLEEKWLPSWLAPELKAGEVAEGIVLSVAKKEAGIRVKGFTGRITNEDIAWTKAKTLDSLLKRGDVILVKIKNVDEAKKEFLADLDQEPLVEGAFVAIEPKTGQIKALAGGYSFARSKFNRATQALRQAGSAIKPILYTAALENGFTAASRIVDEPTDFIDKWTGQPWSPPNYDGKFKGLVTLRKGIEESRNIVTAKVLDYISPQVGVDYCRKFGLSSTIYPYMSLSLGAFEVTILELISAYTAFPNKGIRIKPYFITRIEDKEGNILEENRIETEEVVSPQTAYLMTYLLEGVVQRGTAAAASHLLADKPLAGKTGTTNDFTNAWFIGFSPSLCAGVWVGNDDNTTLGDRKSGAVAALPVWIEFFDKIIQDEVLRATAEGREVPLEQFEVPLNISFVEIDRKTGFIATPICLWPFLEAFLAGTEPERFCSLDDHRAILDYASVDKAKEEKDEIEN